jgi:hypothetical protein
MHRHQRRYWDGKEWTQHIADGQAMAVDPLGAGWTPPSTTAPTPTPLTQPPAVPAHPVPPPPGPGTIAPAGAVPPPPPVPPSAAPPAPPAPPPPAAAPAGGGSGGPGRRALIGAGVVVALVLGTGIFVGVKLGGEGNASGPRTAVEAVGEGKPGTPVSGYLELGESTPPVVATIGTKGGTIDGPVGLRVEVPAGAYSADVPMSVLTTKILGASFGDMVAPASSLVVVDNGGIVAAQPITISIPVTVPDGKFAIAVYYDESKGTLEPLPILSEKDGVLQTVTRHFSSIFVTVVDIALLAQGIIDSGFRPGVDSWQFVNHGSAISTGGHCSGQSLSALWYYDEQKIANSAPSLFGRFDDRIDALPYDATSAFQWDDSDAYRLASMVQTDQYGKGQSTYETMMDKVSKMEFGRLQFYAFAYAILLTGQPQYVGLMAKAGGGHAMIVYAVTPDALLISDPNYPSEYREIPFNSKTGVLGPYEAQATAADAKFPFEYIGYYAKSALINWQGLGGRWDQFLKGTIGDDKFPTMNLEVKQVDDKGVESWVPLANGYKVKKDVTSVTVRAPSTPWDDRLDAYSGSNRILRGGWNTAITVPLKEGVNPLGFAWWYFFWKDYPDGSKGRDKWLDFARLNVIRGELEGPALDLVFVIDLTSSMEDDIAGVKAAATQIVRSIAATGQDWRVAIVGYRDVGDSPMFEDYAFEKDAAAVIGNINALTVHGGGDEPEAVYEALMRAIDSSTIGSWRPNQNKQIILMGDAPPHMPGSGGETAASVARAAELADPVVVQSVVVGNAGVVSPEAQSSYQEISTLTKGRTFTAADAAAVPAVLQQSISATTSAPPVKAEKSTDWARWTILIVSLLLLLAGAAALVLFILRRRPEGARSSSVRTAAAGVALVIGLAGVIWWGVDDGNSSSEHPAGWVDPSAYPGSDTHTTIDPSVTVTVPASTAPGTTPPSTTG